MFKKLATVAAGALLLALAVYGARLWVQGARRDAGARALAQTAGWPEGPSLAARLMVEEYGPPQWASAGRLEWFVVPPWKRIVVRSSPAGFLEHAVSYSIPRDRLPALLSFGRGLRFDPEQGELAASGDSEEHNLLCLNLASDIARGKMTADQARRFYDDTLRKSYAGKSSPYLERLLFAAPLWPEAELPLP
ncbi:MAG: hypothetical protein NTY77_19110 [Elusimicrobia bacterium]|nr:hypothetical protein [Elusimicrobiota bacterium]